MQKDIYWTSHKWISPLCARIGIFFFLLLLRLLEQKGNSFFKLFLIFSQHLKSIKIDYIYLAYGKNGNALLANRDLTLETPTTKNLLSHIRETGNSRRRGCEKSNKFKKWTHTTSCDWCRGFHRCNENDRLLSHLFQMSIFFCNVYTFCFVFSEVPFFDT